MKIGLSMLFCLGRPFPYLAEQLKQVQVTNVELVDEGFHTLNRRRVAAIKKIAKDKGFETTVHGPFADVNIASPDASTRRTVLKRLKRSIMLSGQLDSSLWVFHPGLQTGLSHYYPVMDWKLNIDSVREIVAAAERYGVRVAIENTPDPFPFLLKSVEDFVRFYDDLGEVDLGMTLDVGHANINSQIYKFIEEFPDKIVHAHLHDNRGDFDRHMGVGDGNIDWPRVIGALRKVNYGGTLVVESEENVDESLRRLKILLQNVSE